MRRLALLLLLPVLVPAAPARAAMCQSVVVVEPAGTVEPIVACVPYNDAIVCTTVNPSSGLFEVTVTVCRPAL